MMLKRSSNPGHPAHWHTRDDGWMGPSFNRMSSHVITRKNPLVLRYLLHAHGGALDAARAATIAEQFAPQKPFTIQRLQGGHVQFRIQRGE